MRRFFSFLLAIAIILSCTIPASAAVRDDIEPLYVNILSIQAILSINPTTGIASCSGSVTAKNSYPVKVTVQLQIQENGGWTTLKSWSSTGTTIASVAKGYAVFSGYTYRVNTIGFVYDANGNIIESASTSHSVYYPPN